MLAGNSIYHNRGRMCDIFLIELEILRVIVLSHFNGSTRWEALDASDDDNGGKDGDDLYTAFYISAHGGYNMSHKIRNLLVSSRT